MAVLEHFQACIVIDGKPCQEYAAEEDGEQSETTSEEYPEITKYVEVVAGAQFAVRVQPTKSFDFGKGSAIELQFFSDGKHIMGRMVWEAQVRQKTLIELEGRRVGDGGALCPFKFGTISFRDTEFTDKAAFFEGQYANLATITIKIWLVRGIRPSDAKSSAGKGHLEAIPEAAVKGGAASVQAILGDAERRKGRKVEPWKTKTIGNSPLAEFHFKCRTKEDLQKLSIIPRPRSPIPLEDRPIESLNATEMRQLLIRRKAADELNRVKIKQEKKEANLRELSAIKRSRDEAEEEDETIEVVTIRKKQRREPADIIELD